MNNDLIDKLQEEVKKMKFQLKEIGNTIDDEEYPIASLVISYNWGADDLSPAHDIFEKYSNLLDEGKSWSHYKLEEDFRNQFDDKIGYQEVKHIVLAFWRNHQWNSVCIHFVKSHGDCPPCEFSEIVEYIRDNK